MIVISIGANLTHKDYGPPRATCEAAIAALEAAGIRVLARSPWYESAPVPLSDQPWYVNGVIAVDTDLEPLDLLLLLHRVETEFGRVRSVPNAPRYIDLDLLAYDDRVTATDARPAIPHPRLSERAFVLLPLRDIAPDWRDPRSGLPLAVLIERLPAQSDGQEQAIRVQAE